MRVVVGVVCALAIILAGTSLPAQASVPPEEAAAGPAIRDEPRWNRTFPANHSTGMGLWFWPEGNRVYQLGVALSSFTSLKAYDAGTLAEVASQDLQPQAWSGDPNNELTSGKGRHHVAAVDRDDGRVFVAYRSAATEPDAAAASGSVCAGSAVLSDPGCVGGLHVLDGGSLAPLGKMRLDLSTLEGVRLQVVPKALTYAPAIPELGWGGRVVMVVEELATGPLENSPAPNASSQVHNATARRSSGNLAYAVAFDPESMRQEWAVRLEGCRNSRETRNWMYANEGHPTAVFRAGGDSPALYVGCHGNTAQQGVVVRVPLDADGFPAPLPVRVGDPDDADPEDGAAAVSGLVGAAPRQEVFAGPDKVTVMLEDPVSRRILMRVDDSGQVWWVFDGHANQFVGTIGIGGYDLGHTTYGLDPDTGRLYVLAAKPSEANWTGPGGLYVADTRRHPLPQALVYPGLADEARTGKGPNTGGAGAGDTGRTMSVEPRAGRAANRIFQSDGRVLVDETPVGVDPARDDAVVRTLDVDEAEGVTQATFDGTARGFGFRTILIGGAEGVARVGPADPIGVARGVPQFKIGYNPRETAPTVNSVPPLLPRPDACSDAQRELVVAFVGPRGPAVVDASSARGQAQPVLSDVRTSQDVGAPVTRCLPLGWEGLWQAGLFGRAPVGEPGVAWPFDDAASSCTATGEPQGDSWADPVAGAFSSRVDCSSDEASGWGQARGIGLDGVSVAEALSSFRIYRDDVRGMVARVESVARGIDIGGVVKIGMVRGSAESWANGRKATEPDEGVDESVWNPFNCDRSRPAGTCFERHIFGVRATAPDGKGYGCGPCGDEGALIEGLNRAFGANASARFRAPDRDLARGSADGFVAAVTKQPQERFADIVLNNDLLETMVPMLEVVRYAPHNRPSDQGTTAFEMGVPPRGRQVYQFAAVEVSSTYGIQCLLVYDEEDGTCDAAKEVPGSIQVSLSDPDGEPLAGGAFELRADVDADGVLGLKDTLLPDGACVTAEDGIGTCTFENLQPGSYLVSQVAAPPGYAKSAEPWVSAVASGEQRTVAFTNVSNVSTIDLTATDENGAPISGAAFAAYPDPDSDGKVAPDAQPAAECTTDAAGVCAMKVPAGSYVLVQTGAPGGLEGIEPVAFTFASGGQVAAVTVVNYPPASPQSPEGAASPVVDYSPPVDLAPPMESVSDFVPADPVDTSVAPSVSLPEQIGGTVVQVIRAPGDALRLLSRDPRQAVAWTASLALFALAVLAVRRRQHTLTLIGH